MDVIQVSQLEYSLAPGWSIDCKMVNRLQDQSVPGIRVDRYVRRIAPRTREFIVSNKCVSRQAALRLG